jgi:hypothetical protein
MNCAGSISGPSWRYILQVSPVVVCKMGRLVDIFCDMFASCVVTVLSIIFFASYTSVITSGCEGRVNGS